MLIRVGRVWENIYFIHIFYLYCKRGYFRWGKISRKRWQDISRGGNFHDISHISFLQAYGVFFRVGVIFAKRTKTQKTRKLPPPKNFHVYSTSSKATFKWSFLSTFEYERGTHTPDCSFQHDLVYIWCMICYFVYISTFPRIWQAE